jgi:hypothetical protein
MVRFREHTDLDLRLGPVGLDLSSLSPCRVLELSACDVERLVDRHMCVFVAPIRLVTLVGRGVIGSVERGFVIDNHVLTG